MRRPSRVAGYTLAAVCVVTIVVLRLDFQSAKFAAPPGFVLVGLAVGVALLAAWANPGVTFESHAAAALVAFASCPIFFALRTNVLNADGNMLTPKFERDVPAIGAHLAHDELLELFVHSRVWAYTHRWWGWSVVYSYQVVSGLAGGVFVYAMLRLARRLSPERPWIAIAGIVSGAYMQLFFGDAENYTIAVTLIVFYVLAASRFLEREVPLWVPAATLAVAACFHLEAGWLLPSAAYLAIVSWSRTGDWHEARTSATTAVSIVAAVFVYFHFNGLPLIRFFSSHAGHALRGRDVFAIGEPAEYYANQLKLLLLLCPAVLALAPALTWRARPSDEFTRFLGIAAASMLLLQVVWKSQIGVFEDWNLYSAGALLTSFYIWRQIAGASRDGLIRACGAALAAIGAVYTYAWILANHGGSL